MKRKKSLALKVTGGLLAFALVGAACGGDGNSESGPTGAASESTPSEDSGMDAASAPIDGVESDAAKLNQTLTHLLDDHVYLAGVTLEQAVVNGLDSPQAKAASKTLDDNSVGLAETIASVYGDDAGDQFLELWRKHIGFFVDFTVAQAEGDQKAADKAVADLDGYRADFGALIESATEGALTKDQVAEALIPHVDHLATAATQLVKGDTKVFGSLYTAAEHNLVLSAALSTGIATQQELEGDPTSDSASLQAGLTSLLDSHVYLASVTLEQAVVNGLDSAQAKAASKTLDANSVDLSKAIESLYGADAGKQFLELWRKHIGFFVDFTVAQAEGNEKAANRAVSNLDGYRADFGALIESATEGGLPKDAVADALVMHVDSLAKAATLLVDGDPKVFDAIREAASHNPMLASTLAGAFVEQFPEKF